VTNKVSAGAWLAVCRIGGSDGRKSLRGQGVRPLQPLIAGAAHWPNARCARRRRSLFLCRGSSAAASLRPTPRRRRQCVAHVGFGMGSENVELVSLSARLVRGMVWLNRRSRARRAHHAAVVRTTPSAKTTSNITGMPITGGEPASRSMAAMPSISAWRGEDFLVGARAAQHLEPRRGRAAAATGCHESLPPWRHEPVSPTGRGSNWHDVGAPGDGRDGSAAPIFPGCTHPHHAVMFLRTAIAKRNPVTTSSKISGCRARGDRAQRLQEARHRRDQAWNGSTITPPSCRRIAIMLTRGRRREGATTISFCTLRGMPANPVRARGSSPVAGRQAHQAQSAHAVVAPSISGSSHAAEARHQAHA